MKQRVVTKVKSLALLFAITYMVSYITRTNFGAVISEMISSTGISKSLLSMSLTGSFITYGIGQIISGFLGDLVSPKRLVTAGLVLTVLMNLAIPFCESPYLMLIVWCINGFAQSFMWPPMVKLMTAHLTEEEYKISVGKVSWGSSFGTIFVYLISPLIISIAGWKWVFFLSAACGALMIVFWNLFSPDAAIRKREKSTKSRGNSGILKTLFCPLMIGVMIVIVLQGMLRDGVTTWMPSYLAETYELSNSISIFTGVVMPIFGILCYQIATHLYVKKLRNPLSCAGVFLLFGTASALGLFLFTGSSPALSVLFTAILIGCMHGVNLMLVCMIPPYFKKFGNVSTASGVINSCTYVGSAVSTYGVALLSEVYGWSVTLFVWFGCAAAAALICFFCIPAFRKKFIS